MGRKPSGLRIPHQPCSSELPLGLRNTPLWARSATQEQGIGRRSHSIIILNFPWIAGIFFLPIAYFPLSPHPVGEETFEKAIQKRLFL